MDGNRIANMLADLVSRREGFQITIGGHRYTVYPSMVYIPGPFFDALHASMRGTMLPEPERLIRRSTDDTFVLSGYFHHPASIGGSPKQSLMFSASSVDAIGI